MTVPRGRTPLNVGVERFQAESGGLMMLSIIQPADLPFVIADAAAGDAEAGQLLQQIITVTDNIRSAPRKRRMLCGACPRPLRPDMGFAVVVAIPGCDDPSAGLALAICTRCGSDRASITAKAAVALRRIWPDLRPIMITNPAGGHA